jgi:transposase
MRGFSDSQPMMIAYISLEKRVPKEHPLRKIKFMADRELKALSRVFDKMYSPTGRPSIPPERVLKSMLLMAFFSVRSERQFCEQLGYNLLFRWFLDMELTDESFDFSVFSKNRERLLEHEVGRLFFDAVVRQARQTGLTSDDHFTVDGTLLEAWASLKSFRPREEDPSKRPDDGDSGNPTVNFHGEKRSNATHESTSDPESRLLRKGPGQTAKLCYGAHALMDNRHGLLVDFRITSATGTAEVEAAEAMLKRQARKRIYPRTLGGDKGYDRRRFVAMLRGRRITPHVAENWGRRGGSAIDGRTTRHLGYQLSQRARKRVEEIFGWIKTIGGFRRTRYKGVLRTQLAGWFVGAAYNLLRMAKLRHQGAEA